jgi:hypothetical protein
VSDRTPLPQPSTARSAPTPGGIDPRGPRFGAAVTAVLLAATLVLGTTTPAVVLLSVVTALFAVGVARGAQGSVQGLVDRSLIRPRLAAPSELEDPAPPRFAQGVGLAVGLSGLVVAALGVPEAVPVAASVALVAAFLNAAFGYCIGCEMYLVLRRLRPGRA